MTSQHGRRGPVVVAGLAAASGCGRGLEPLLERTAAGAAVFTAVSRFDTARYRADLAAQLPGAGDLPGELAGAVADACTAAGFTGAERADCELLLAVRGDSGGAGQSGPAGGAHALASRLAKWCGLRPPARAYTAACVAAGTAVADAAAMITSGRAMRVVVAAGFLVDEYHFALFDAGRALATDGRVRAFSSGRTGMLLGDAAAAVVLEAAAAARQRAARPLARLAGWGRAGDAYHVSQPHPEGAGLARAVRAALHRAGCRPEEIGYINAHGTGTPHSDAAEAAGLHAALGGCLDQIPVSSSKTVHGHTLEAAGLLELVVTVLALGTGRIPVNAGFLAPDERCRLDLVTCPRSRRIEHALSVNAAFGGANTALVVGAA